VRCGIAVADRVVSLLVIGEEWVDRSKRVAAALNALGVSTRDMMSIFQTMKRAGALQAELVLN
jgi:flagellar P-ring protein precursor FlgI